MLDRSTLKSTGWGRFRCPEPLSRLAGETLNIARTVFALPEAQKQRCSSPETNYQSGWRKSGQENRPTEVWHVGFKDPPETWPTELTAHHHKILEFLNQTIDAISPGLDRLMQDFGSTPGELQSSLRRGPSVVRLLHYDAGGAEIRFAEHTDFGLASLFVAESVPGLQLKALDGEWVLGMMNPDNWIFAAGEMLGARSSGVISPTLHRVISTPVERWAVTIFLHPDTDYPIYQGSNGEVVTAGEFFGRLMQRVYSRLEES